MSNKTIRSSGKLSNIAFIKTIMMVVIVLYHSFLFFGGSWFTPVEPAGSADYLYYIAKWMNTFHIQTFAMASGFLFYFLWSEKGKYNDFKKDIKKRAKRLLVPYFFTCLLWVVPIATYFFKYSFTEVVDRYLLMAAPSQLWFIIMLFVVFVFFELVGKKIKLSFKNLFLVYIITAVVGNALSAVDFNYFQLATAIKYVLYFYLGGYIYRYGKNISWKQTIMMIIGAAILYAAVVIFGDSGNTIIKYSTRFIEPVVSILEVSAIYFLCSKFALRCGGILKNKFYRLLEENSFGIYLFHQQIIYFTIIWLNGLIHPVVQALLSFVIALFTSLLMSWLLKKWRVTRFMFGL